jgi:hypothetical protein
MSRLENKDMTQLRGAQSLNIDDPDMRQGKSEHHMNGERSAARRNLSKIYPKVSHHHHHNAIFVDSIGNI